MHEIALRAAPVDLEQTARVAILAGIWTDLPIMASLLGMPMHINGPVCILSQ
ncbi:hypothetical protein ACMDCT_04615 [Halomonadaceae bacterium KBTZ08]